MSVSEVSGGCLWQRSRDEVRDGGQESLSSRRDMYGVVLVPLLVNTHTITHNSTTPFQLNWIDSHGVAPRGQDPQSENGLLHNTPVGHPRVAAISRISGTGAYGARRVVQPGIPSGSGLALRQGPWVFCLIPGAVREPRVCLARGLAGVCVSVFLAFLAFPAFPPFLAFPPCSPPVPCYTPRRYSFSSIYHFGQH